jgi:pantoate--beta-alanine ligase
MVRDLNFAVQVVACPIVREADGLAMSSRNVYLNPEERKQALVLHRALLRVQDAWEGGEHDAGKLLEVGRGEVAKETGVRLDYFEIVDADSLEPVKSAGSGVLVALAAWVGSTRLIDNLILEVKSADHKGH